MRPFPSRLLPSSSSPRASAFAHRVLSILIVLAGVGALTLLTSCSEEVGTSIRVSLVYKNSWKITSADVVAADSEGASEIAHELLVLVPDERAGQVMPIEVWGVRDGERIAHGSAVALPRKGETVGATIVLERLPCGVFCTPGDLRCEGEGRAMCEHDADDCLQWGEPQGCPTDTPFCTDGECRNDCDDECTAGEGVCVDSATQRSCGQYDSDMCLDFSADQPCAGGQLCYGGRCAAPCTYDANLANTAVPDTTDAAGPTMALARDGTLHAVYSGTDAALMYLRRPPAGAWTTPVAIGATGAAPALAIDPLGKLHLSFTAGGVRYGARDLGGTWTFANVELGAAIGATTAIAVEDDGVVHIVYRDATNSLLRHAQSTSATTFSLETADTQLGYGCAMVIVDGALHVVSFSDANNLWYSTRDTTGAWTSERIADLLDGTLATFARASIGVDREKTLHVAYTDAHPISDLLRYTAKTTLGSWSNPRTIDNLGSRAGGYPALAVDLFDGVHVASRTTGASPTLRYAFRPAGTNSTWSLASQPPSTPGQEPAIAVDSAGRLHLLSGAPPTGLVETTRTCQ
ncbi:MAG: hypothetical protein R3B48_10565 [Kofleriaceae bacterium]